MQHNIMLLTDSYKATHWKQYPKGTTRVYSYLESRGGKFSKTKFFGLQYFIKTYLADQVVTQQKIDEADAFYAQHLGPGLFNRAGWEHILNKHNGHLPIEIKAVPEGIVVPTSNVLMTVENTDDECFWLTNYIESILLQVWYPTTVATLSLHMKELILEYLEKTGDVQLIPFKLHDFGFRGVSSVESAGLGGAAHLTNFLGTDTIAGIKLAQEHYKTHVMLGFSIPASEHSTITSWGRECEAEALENMLDQYPEGLVACVSDQYDIISACKNIWGNKLKDKILKRNGTLVVRPDSGNPVTMIVSVLNALGEAFGFTVNDKGFKVLPPQIRVIYGDGINYDSLEEILKNMLLYRWSVDNTAFGCGGALLQSLNRDTQRFAFKCSSVVVNGVEREVYKDPVSDKGKRSKRGRLKLIKHKGWLDHSPSLETLLTVAPSAVGDDILQTVFLNGALTKEYTFEEVRDQK